MLVLGGRGVCITTIPASEEKNEGLPCSCAEIRLPRRTPVIIVNECRNIETQPSPSMYFCDKVKGSARWVQYEGLASNEMPKAGPGHVVQSPRNTVT